MSCFDAKAMLMFRARTLLPAASGAVKSANISNVVTNRCGGDVYCREIEYEHEHERTSSRITSSISVQEEVYLNAEFVHVFVSVFGKQNSILPGE